MDTLYGYLLPSDEEKALKEHKEVVRIMGEPTLYTNVTLPIMQGHTLILDRPLPMYGTNKFVDTAEYDQLYEAIVRFFIDPPFIANGTYSNFKISAVENHLVGDQYIEFVWANQLKFIITNKLSSFIMLYPAPSKYYVVFDESQTVEDNEMLDLMVELCNELGKNNRYSSVIKWTYLDEGGLVKYNFYIFYSGARPGEMIQQETIRTYVIKKYGEVEAKKKFPKLFVSSKRRVFCLYDNETEPINYEMLVRFVKKYNIYSPDVCYVLDYISPIIVEYGILDVYPTYSKNISETDTLNNTFLFYISTVLNYYNGKKLTKEFIKESMFTEEEDYCSVVTSGIEWQIMKRSYKGAYLPDEDDD